MHSCDCKNSQTGQAKRTYATQSQADLACEESKKRYADGDTLNTYYCPEGECWHVGNSWDFDDDWDLDDNGTEKEQARKRATEIADAGKTTESWTTTDMKLRLRQRLSNLFAVYPKALVRGIWQGFKGARTGTGGCGVCTAKDGKHSFPCSCACHNEVVRDICTGNGIVELTDESFDRDVLKSEQPVMVDFWSAWCGPSKARAPIVEEVATAYSGKIKVGKMDVDKNVATPQRYGVRGIPTLLIFKGGKMQEQIVGYVPKETIQKAIDKHISG